MADQSDTHRYALIGIVTALAVVVLVCLTIGLLLLAWLSLSGI